jgi:hypothetical protein
MIGVLALYTMANPLIPVVAAVDTTFEFANPWKAY